MKIAGRARLAQEINIFKIVDDVEEIVEEIYQIK
jgi:hypothetical protein